ncbi:MAG: hypothetical protein A2Y57_03935 [Candidatus Woykebacteria bacterium RBG_13_40_7b]|uniref:RNA-binding protein KhpA n=1 Tax=Candidatus Woykebacteria bacterium RBG_13_40_7b TaxID=1802594 RepID=A0A1G1W7Q5_9BACT|nr:MAG: hypothetical protein A2Y57_03935 [Candidatus Woykebacteria bacterium RBG_13_40_7b]
MKLDDILKFILLGFIEKETDLKIKQTEVEGILNFEILLNEADVGRVIGKGGRTLKSIRNILRIVAAKEGRRVNLQIVK